jgi:PEGA domain-containing protein
VSATLRLLTFSRQDDPRTLLSSAGDARTMDLSGFWPIRAGIFIAQLLYAGARLPDEAPVSLHKRILLICALALVVCVGSTTRADAQFRRSRVVVVGGFYDPFWSPYWYDPWWGPYQWGPYPYPSYPPYRYYRDPGAAVRLEVKPKEAEVYVDGFYAGIVDDFDGLFQRLRVPPGEHDITLYRDGFRTVTQKVYLTPDKTFKIKYAMEPLRAGEQAEPRPQPPAPPPGAQAPYPPGGAPPNAPYPPEPPVRRGAPRPMPPNAPPPNMPPNMPPPGAQRPGAEGYGTISIRVQPADAEVLIDREVWHGPADRDRLVVDVAEGRHSIEIRKSGYRSYVTEVDVRRGETTPVNVSLRGQNEQ